MTPRLNPLSTLRALRRHPHVAREEILAFQNKQLRRLVAHAYENVPYYRRLFAQNGLKPQDIHSVADLSAIPITAKKDLQSLPVEEVVARGVDASRDVPYKTLACGAQTEQRTSSSLDRPPPPATNFP